MNITYISERKRALGLTNTKISEMTGITLSTLDKITSGAYAAEMNRQGVAERHRLDPTQADFETRAVRSEAEVRPNTAIE